MEKYVKCSRVDALRRDPQSLGGWAEPIASTRWPSFRLPSFPARPIIWVVSGLGWEDTVDSAVNT